MFTIEPVSYHGGDEELGTVGVLSSIGHGKKSGLCVLASKVLV